MIDNKLKDMAKLESFSDLHKFAKTLLDDDYNHGQALVVKAKSTSEDGKTVGYLIRIICFQLSRFNVLFRRSAAPTSKVLQISQEIQRLLWKQSLRQSLPIGQMNSLQSKTDQCNGKERMTF